MSSSVVRCRSMRGMKIRRQGSFALKLTCCQILSLSRRSHRVLHKVSTARRFQAEIEERGSNLIHCDVSNLHTSVALRFLVPPLIGFFLLDRTGLDSPSENTSSGRSKLSTDLVECREGKARKAKGHSLPSMDDVQVVKLVVILLPTYAHSLEVVYLE
jgi:hypothetical protein